MDVENLLPPAQEWGREYFPEEQNSDMGKEFKMNDAYNVSPETRAGIVKAIKAVEEANQLRRKRVMERMLPSKSGERKIFPMGTGLLDYFPDALAAVSEVSYRGNQKHNPGEPLHWARGKSMDHADCIIRHFVERGSRDEEGNRHSAQLAWRALALLQEEIEAELKLGHPRGATA
jgi:Domain of unknown function (DUF5664)